MDRKTLTVEEAAEVLGIARSSAYKAAKRGELPCISVGGRILVVRERLEAMLSADLDHDEQVPA